jgi:uncharacterized metal-binding protein YceD (DUF177 family)
LDLYLAQIIVKMNKRKEFLIPFVGLKLGKHHFEYQINNTFFELFDFQDFNNSNVKVNLTLDKKSTFLEIAFKHVGTVNVPCDMTNEEFDLSIKGKMKLIVRFGDLFNDENEELLVLPHGDFQVDVAQYIYEMIVLSVPLRRVHPGIKDGSLESLALVKLNELKGKELVKKKEKNNQEKSIDPRWEKLKQLLTDK